MTKYGIGEELTYHNGMNFVTVYVVGYREDGTPITSIDKPIILKEEVPKEVPTDDVEVVEIKAKKPRKKKAE